jgi:anti-anti-sigma factor
VYGGLARTRVATEEVTMTSGRAAQVPPLRVTTRVAGPGVVEIMVAGEVDLSTAAELPEALAAALAEHHPRRVELELHEVPFMDSSGINLLVRSRRMAREAGSELVITRIRHPVHRVLAIFGLVEVFCPDIEPEPAVPGEDTDGNVA